MSQETNVAIHNLAIHLAKIRTLEKELNEISKNDGASIGSLRAKTIQIKHEKDALDSAFAEFVGNEGLPQTFHLIDVIVHFWNKARKTLILPN